MSVSQPRVARATIPRLTPVHLWVAGAAMLNLAGWALSLLGALNTAGYAAVSAVSVLSVIAWRYRSGCGLLPDFGSAWTRLRHRFRRPLPFCFVLMAGLILLSGLLHAPNNDDALSYRIPRVLNWLAEHRWHWIHTPDAAMNSHVVGTEWLLAPWLALTGTDRWIFLINFAGFLLLPGLVFSVFRGLGVRRLVAWHWMWLLPSGYNYILQAGGDANDLLGVIHALAAMHFALRARRTSQASDAWFSILAAAVLTGCKLSNLPLLLPVALALLPSIKALLARPLSTAAVLVLGTAASVVPIAAINWHYCRDWTGTANERYLAGAIAAGATGEGAMAAASTNAEPVPYVFVIKDPLVGVSGNCLSLACDNFFPPAFPAAGWWNTHNRDFLPSSYRAKLAQNFEVDFLHLRELPGEERAGLGFGICWLLLFGCITGWVSRNGLPIPPANQTRTMLARATRWSPYLSLLFFMTKSGISASARIIAPYYALLLPALLQGRGQEEVTRRRGWSRAELGVYLLAFGVLLVSPERPLWPAQTILKGLERDHPDNTQLRRAGLVYEVYASRADAFAPLRQWLPANVRTIGMVCMANEPSTSLWRPFRQHRVYQSFFSDPRSALEGCGVQYIVVRNTGAEFDAWLKRMDGEILGTATLKLYASRDPIAWSIVRLRPAR